MPESRLSVSSGFSLTAAPPTSCCAFCCCSLLLLDCVCLLLQLLFFLVDTGELCRLPPPEADAAVVLDVLGEFSMAESSDLSK